MDPIVGGALVGAAGNLIGGFMSGSAQAQANRTNLRIAREQMAFAEGQTAKQMDFQERMSSSAHQREVADLKAAGLNPMLGVAKGMSGSSTPAGAAADPVPVRVSPVNRLAGVQSALQVARQIAELKQIEADTRGKHEGATLASAEAHQIVNLFGERLKELRNRNAISDLEWSRLNQLLPLVVQDIRSQIDSRNASARAARAGAKLSELDAQYYIPYLNPALGILRAVPGLGNLLPKKAGGLTINNFPKR